MLEGQAAPFDRTTVEAPDTVEQAFLLCGPLSQSSWPKKLADSRSAYSSLRDHFLRYINNPNDLQSSIDPLADDDNVRDCLPGRILL